MICDQNIAVSAHRYFWDMKKNVVSIVEVTREPNEKEVDTSIIAERLSPLPI